MNNLPVFHMADGSRFVPSQVHVPQGTPFDGWSRDDMRLFMNGLWRDCFDAKRPEMERLKNNSLYYDGFHYTNPWLNRRSYIENHVFRVVEAQVANTVAQRPRPEIVPIAGTTLGGDTAQRLQQYATFLMNLSDFDHAIYLGARDQSIYGWNAWLTSFDFQTGMPYPKNLSVFDTYWDPAGRNEFECGHFFIGMPVPTARLRATYPHVARLITPDRIASPSYEVAVRPWQEYLENAHEYGFPMMADNALAVHQEGDVATDGVALVSAPMERSEHGSTTFLLQGLIEDPETVPCTYFGEWIKPDGTSLHGMKFTWSQPRTPSGWWKISMTATGVLLEPPKKLDDAYMGNPLTFDRALQRVDRFVSQSEVDQILPLQRGINRRNELLDRALELAANPPVLATGNSGLRNQLQGGPVIAGDLLDINRGSEVKYLEFRGPDGPQFQRVAEQRQAVQSVSGVQDAMEGARPTGIEAAAAIRRLDDNSLRRLRGRQNPQHRARALLLRKIMYGAGKKLKREIAFTATDGSPMSISPDELTKMFHIDFAPGSGTVEGVRDRKDEAIALYDREAIDVLELLKQFSWPNAQEVAARMQVMQIKQAAAEAAAKASAAPPGKSGAGAKGKSLQAA